MSEESLKRKTINSILWKIGETGGNQIIQFAISVVLARLIMPDQFGLIVELTVFIAIARIFIDSGFSNALIRKNNRTQEDCSTVYWFNIIVAIVCYWIIFFCAPLVARFYDEPQLTSILRVTAIGIVIGSFAGVHRTLLTADMDFKSLTQFNILGLIISGLTGIALALKGFQVWALVAQNLMGTILGTIFVICKVRWKPWFKFCRNSLKEFFGFGSKLLASALLDTLYSNVYSIVIGKVYKPADLAFYSRAQNLMQITSATPTYTLQSVTYPALCKLQDNNELLAEGYRKMIRISSFVVIPLTLGLGAVAFPFINVVYTDRWIFAATLLSIICFGQLLLPIHALNLNYLIVKGRSDLVFRLEIIKKIQAVVVLCFTVPIGLEAMCWGSVINSYISLLYNTYYTRKLLKLSIIRQLGDIWPTLLLGLIMFAGARSVACFLGNDIVSLISSVLIGAIIFLGGALLFRFPELSELKNIRK